MKLNLDNLTLKDTRDFLDLREKHDRDFIEWCAKHSYAGVDDELDNHFMYLEKVIEFFNNRGYIND